MRRRLPRGPASACAWFLALSLIAGCEGGSTVEVPPSITLTANTTSLDAPRGIPSAVLLTIVRNGGFDSDVTFRAENLPAGMIAQFGPSKLDKTATASELTVIAGPSTPAGNATIRIVASGEGIEEKSINLPINVLIPSVDLSLGASTASVAQVQSTTVPITISRAGGYNGVVGLSIVGLPLGVTGTFSPAVLQTGETTSILTLSPTIAAPIGTINVTIRAAAAGLEQKTLPLQITITPSTTPAVVVTVDPVNVNVNVGFSTSTIVNISRSGGFTGPVSLGIEGLPAGVTASFSPSPATGNTATLTLTAASPVFGQINLQVIGTAPGIQQSTTPVVLRVALPFTLGGGSAQPEGIQAGATLVTGFSLTRNNGFAEDIAITLEGVPPGITITGIPSSIPPGTSVPNSPVLVSATAGTPLGLHTITVRATAPSFSQVENISLNVTAGAFNIALAPNAITIRAGQTSLVTVTINKNAGFTGAVTTSFPSVSVGPSFGTALLVSESQEQAQYSLSARADAVPGVYSLIIRAQSPGLSTVSLPLRVTVIP